MEIKQFTLYHGSDTNVKMPVWDSGSRYRDFGQCFYTTYDLHTAKDWAEKRSIITPTINKYALNLKRIKSSVLRIKRFNADTEWARFVFDNRENEKFKRPAYDIIIGPIADRGLANLFMKVKSGEKTFDEIAPLIQYNRFKSYQVAFCSNNALDCLTYLDK